MRTCHSSKAYILYNRIHYLSSPFFKVFEIIFVNSLCNTVRFTRAVILYHILTILSSVNFHFSHYHLVYFAPLTRVPAYYTTFLRFCQGVKWHFLQKYFHYCPLSPFCVIIYNNGAAIRTTPSVSYASLPSSVLSSANPLTP